MRLISLRHGCQNIDMNGTPPLQITMTHSWLKSTENNFAEHPSWWKKPRSQKSVKGEIKRLSQEGKLPPPILPCHS